MSRLVLFVAALCLAMPLYFTESATVLLAAFFVFEICVGLFWPAMGYMRGLYVPETGGI